MIILEQYPELYWFIWAFGDILLYLYGHHVIMWLMFSLYPSSIPGLQLPPPPSAAPIAEEEEFDEEDIVLPSQFKPVDDPCPPPTQDPLSLTLSQLIVFHEAPPAHDEGLSEDSSPLRASGKVHSISPSPSSSPSHAPFDDDYITPVDDSDFDHAPNNDDDNVDDHSTPPIDHDARSDSDHSTLNNPLATPPLVVIDDTQPEPTQQPNQGPGFDPEAFLSSVLSKMGELVAPLSGALTSVQERLSKLESSSFKGFEAEASVSASKLASLQRSLGGGHRRRVHL